eukprot:gene10716-16494_t
MIVGKVGCGKSTLLQGLLNEVTESKGDTHYKGSVAYCPQTPWIFSGSIRANIEWGRLNSSREFSDEDYQKVVRNVSLVADLKSQLKDGDATLIGEKGINISGGQKSRVSLARALYNDADIYLLDDILSAVDAHVGAHIFQHAIVKQLKGKTRILTTNQLQFLQYADKAYCIERDEAAGVSRLVQVDPKARMADISPGTAYYQLIAEFERQQQLASQSRQEELDKASSIVSTAVSDTTAMRAFRDKQFKGVALTIEEDVDEGTLDWKVYANYYSYFGGKFWWFVIVCGHIAFNVADKYAQIWIGWYADRHGLQSAAWDTGYYVSDKSVGFWFGIYVGILIVGCIVLGAREFMFASGAVKPCYALYHDELLALLNSPIQFFDTTPVGRILTRFVNDWEAVDFQVPLYTSQCFLSISLLVGSLILMAITIQYFSAMFIVIFAVM